MNDGDVTLGELYRLLERVEKKIDETNTYAHTESHDLRNAISVNSTKLEILRLKTEGIEKSVSGVDGRVDKIYQQASMLAAVVSSLIWAALQLLASWWKHV